MEKRLHNHISESILTLYSSAIYCFITWIAAGLFTHNLWLQMALMAATCYLMVEMSKHLIFLRLRSWMVTSAFMMLSSCCAFNYDSTSAGIIGISAVATLFLLLSTYQNPQDVGHSYYAYVVLGITSLFFIKALYFIPLMWLLTLLMLQSLSFHTWLASILGTITPYWLIGPWYIYKQDYDILSTHFEPLFNWHTPTADDVLTPIRIVIFVIIGILFILGAINFWSKSYEERIRTRQYYGFLQWMVLALSIFVLLQPQYYDTLIRVIIICACPFAAHFFTLNSSKITNYLFFITLAIIMILSVISTNESLTDIANHTLLEIWNG
ncbi:hypothetical protein L6472_09725 [Prevotella sp. E13-17]|uniref:hypothetical protein n=1 Tax=Prevotella sp. E13-17 TaxID=2913616 RepID=UPI001EDBCEE6|nr:hypothetical protein [Prevotella sp. E13-17]UKK50300.1 hypothetical protein L6472_09725 [Prevotella sp. E13-17]